MSQYRPAGLLLPLLISWLNWFALKSPFSANYVIKRAFGDDESALRARDVLVLLTLIGAAIANLLPAPPAWWALALPLVFAHRLVDALVAGLRVIFSATSDAFAVNDARRTFLLTLLNVFTVILMFAVSDRWLTTGWPQYFEFMDANCKPVKAPYDFVYMSWTNLTTLGSSFKPHDIGAQVLNIAEVTSGLLLLTVIVAVVLGSVHPAVRRDR